MEEITSVQNPAIKLVRSLSGRKQRQETGLFAFEGIEHARKAQANGFIPHLLFLDRDQAGDPSLQELVSWAARWNARTAVLPVALMSRISTLSNPQALILACRQRWHPMGAGLADTDVALALDRIRDPGNLGTIMRTAEAAAVTRFFLIGDSCDPFAPEAVRASAGSVFAMAMSRLAQDDFLSMAKTWPGDVVGTHLAATESFRQSYRRPVLLLLGSESRGLSEDLASVCSKLVRIPMAAGVESLNVATATALMLYELQLPLLTEGSLSTRDRVTRAK